MFLLNNLAVYKNPNLLDDEYNYKIYGNNSLKESIQEKDRKFLLIYDTF
jgi:hypothetical protein